MPALCAVAIWQVGQELHHVAKSDVEIVWFDE